MMMIRQFWWAATLVFLNSQRGAAFFFSTPVTKTSTTVDYAGLAPVNPDTTGITEPACLDAADRMRYLTVPVPSFVHPDEQVDISFSRWPAENKKSEIPIILIHGFDSSALEYRRLGSVLAAQGFDVFAVDILGWGFTQLDGVASFSAPAKIEAMNAFVDKVSDGGPFCVVGSSLGGAAAIEIAADNPNCASVVLMAAQGFVDGIGPMASLPKPLAKLGVQVLKSTALRAMATQMSYFDKETYGTPESIVVGRMHCLREGWSDALVAFMQSGGFSPSAKVEQIEVPTLIMWGRQDNVLDGSEFAPQFLEKIPDSKLVWMEECGHVPHLEKPQETAVVIRDFLLS